MICPHCGHGFCRTSGDLLKVRVPILIFKADGAAYTSCPKCKMEVGLPITLVKSEIAKDLTRGQKEKPPKLVLRRHLTGRPKST